MALAVRRVHRRVQVSVKAAQESSRSPHDRSMPHLSAARGGKNGDHSMNIWQTYRVQFLGITSLCGSVPADPEIVKAWVDARKPRVQPPGGKTLDEVTAEVMDSLARGEVFD